jgi:hypothetical protein
MTPQAMKRDEVLAYVEGILGESEHAGRVLSIANGVYGAMHSAALGVHAIGTALARNDGLVSKHTIKQVDRLLSNPRFDVMRCSQAWIAHVVGELTEVTVALDWTDYDGDKQATVSLALVTQRGRSIPLLWRTVRKSELEGQRNRFEDELLTRFHERVPLGVRVTVTADRGFADQKLFGFMETLGFDYVIRIPRETTIYSAEGCGRPAKQWLLPSGRTRQLCQVRVTHDQTAVPVFVAVKQAKMKAAWFLVSSRDDWKASQILQAYGRRFTIEEMFRDEKDWRFGMGLSHTKVSRPDRRDRLLFLGAIARYLITRLGAAGESLGMDRGLKANTSPKRTHSLYRQGCYYFASLAAMKLEPFRLLMRRFGEFLLNDAAFFAAIGLSEI